MSEFEGYQNSGGSDVQYESMATPEGNAGGQPAEATATTYGYPQAEATAVPVATAAAAPNDADPALAAAGKAGAAVSGFMEKIGRMGVLLGIAVASLIYTIAAGSLCFGVDGNLCYGELGYAFSAGIISLVVCVVLIILIRFTSILNDLIHHILGWFFAVWWAAACFTATFDAPFTTLDHANGYFAVWAALLFSFFYLAMVSPIFKARAEKLKALVASQAFGDLVFLEIASIVELVAAAIICKSCTDYYAYALALGCVSVAITAICIFLSRQGDKAGAMAQANSALVIFLWVWWVLGFCLVTFPAAAPFNALGNGYFSTAAAVYFSTRALRATTLWKLITDGMKNAVGPGGGGTAAPSAGDAYVSGPAYQGETAQAESDGMDF